MLLLQPTSKPGTRSPLFPKCKELKKGFLISCKPQQDKIWILVESVELNLTFGCKILDLYVYMCTVHNFSFSILGHYVHSCAKIVPSKVIIECSHMWNTMHWQWHDHRCFKIRPVVIIHIDFHKTGPTNTSLWVGRSAFEEFGKHRRPHSPPCGYISS